MLARIQGICLGLTVLEQMPQIAGFLAKFSPHKNEVLIVTGANVWPETHGNWYILVSYSTTAKCMLKSIYRKVNSAIAELTLG